MQIVVDEALSGLRLDVLLARAGAVASVNAGRRAIAAGTVVVDGRPARKGDHVTAGQVITFADPGAAVRPEPAPELPLVVLHEDADLIAVAKPAGVPSHPLRVGEGPTVAGAIVARFPECATASEDPREGGLAHRLDRGTSGVLLAARTRECWLRLREALGAVGCEKLYLAETVGAPAAPTGDPLVVVRGDLLVVMAPIGRTGRRGGRVRVGGAGRQPLDARTDVRIVERREGHTLVEARLSRGRAHQVRAHLAYLGSPVVGDATYGDAPAEDEGIALHLHAAVVTVRHPADGRALRIEAPLPRWAMPRAG